MIVLQVKGLSKSYITNTIFTNLSFAVNEGDKVGIVGPNGAGKSTLFRCLLSEEDVDTGQIMISPKHTLGYLEQIPTYTDNATLLDTVLAAFADVFQMRHALRQMEYDMGTKDGEALEELLIAYAHLTEQYEAANGFSIESRSKGVLIGLGFFENDFDREITCFSGGEKTRINLACLLVREPDILLLDEPTNHLDLHAVEWLEMYLKNYRGTILLISHDQYFLDEVATRIFSLEHQQLKDYQGNYSRYLMLREEQEMAQHRAFVKQQAAIAETEEYIRRYKAGIKSKQARGRAKHLSRVEKLTDTQQRKNMQLSSWHVQESGEIVLEATGISLSFHEKPLFEGIDFILHSGEKVGLIGSNGSGKSTFLKILLQTIQPDQGTIHFGARVKLAYYDQHLENLDENRTMLEELHYSFGLNLSILRDWLAKILFFGDDVNKTIRDLSGGERARLSLLKIVLEEPNFIILDEPTNHLDIDSKIIIENFLDDFQGSLLVVSHDRYLLDAVTTKIIEINHGRFDHYLGNYSYYRYKKNEKERIALEQAEAAQKNIQDGKKNKAKQHNGKKNLLHLRRELAELEEAIALLEEKKDELTDQLSDETIYKDVNGVLQNELILRYQTVENEIQTTYTTWENLMMKLEEEEHYEKN